MLPRRTFLVKRLRTPSENAEMVQAVLKDVLAPPRHAIPATLLGRADEVIE